MWTRIREFCAWLSVYVCLRISACCVCVYNLHMKWDSLCAGACANSVCVCMNLRETEKYLGHKYKKLSGAWIYYCPETQGFTLQSMAALKAQSKSEA